MKRRRHSRDRAAKGWKKPGHNKYGCILVMGCKPFLDATVEQRGRGGNCLHHCDDPYVLTSFPIPRRDKNVSHTRDVTLENEMISMSLSLSSMSDNMTITHPPLSTLIKKKEEEETRFLVKCERV